MVSLKRAEGPGIGIVALPGYVCCEQVRSGELVRVLPGWFAGDRNGPRPSVRGFVDHLALEFPKVVLLG
jgi:DNA-binding transcriptional LysR family regulator